MPDGEVFSSGLCSLTRGSRVAGAISRAHRPHRRQRTGAPRVATEHCTGCIDVIRAADEERSALVQLGGLDVENPLVTIGRGAARLFDDESERARLVKQTEFATL